MSLPKLANLSKEINELIMGYCCSAESVDGSQGVSTDETDYSALFETSRFSSSFDSDDEDKYLDRHRGKSSPTHLAQTGSPVYFGLAQVCNYVLCDSSIVETFKTVIRVVQCVWLKMVSLFTAA